MKDKAIWIDKEKAHILTLAGEDVKLNTVFSDFKELHEDGADRQGGATEVLKDRKSLEREKQMIKHFFSALSLKLKNAKRIVIMGPAQMGKHFYKYLVQDKADLGNRVVEVIRSDKMTENQLKATVREFYLSKS